MALVRLCDQKWSTRRSPLGWPRCTRVGRVSPTPLWRLLSTSTPPERHGLKAFRLLWQRFQARLCYSDDGSFSLGHVDLVSVLITAQGVYSSCVDVGCLASREFRCYALLGVPAAGCEVPIEGVLGEGFFSWSAQVVGIYSGNGEPLPLQIPGCGDSPADAGAFCVDNCTGRNLTLKPVQRAF